MALVKIFQELKFLERDAVQTLLENLPVEADLAVKVIVDRSDIGARSLGNLTNADAFEAVSEKELFCVLKQ